MDSIYKDRKERIYEYICSKEYKPLKIKQMAAMIGVPSEDRGEFRNMLSELVTEGKIVIDNRGMIKPEKANIKIGKLSLTQRGFGFVILDDGEKDDIFIHESDIGDAMHGDTVKVGINEGTVSGKRREGVILEVIERGTLKVVGTLDRSNNYAFVIPDNVRQLRDVFIPKEKIGDAQNGQKVVAKITNYGNGHDKNPEGEIVEILGYAGEAGVDILSIAKACGLPDEFPENVIREADKMPDEISEEDIVGRKDIRDWVTITIDGEDAKDLDDAVTLTYEEGVYTLGVHIADVTNYVKEGSPLDKEAVARGTSAYLVDRVIPMLPKKLSNGICSLNEKTDRLALSCIMKLDSNGNVTSHEICETVINVNHRMTYTSVNKMVELDDAEEKEKYNDILDMTMLMKELALKRIEIRRKKGSIDFDFPESKIILDEKGKPVEIKPYERNLATRIIEEFMLVTNETIAEDYYWQEQPFLYRSHESPDPQKIHELSVFVSNFGLRVKTSGEEVHPKEIQKLLAGIQGIPEENLISRLTLRSMKRARYTVGADGHFGLASKYYCHFTSPIRRYPDLQIHRIIKENLHGKLNEKRTEHYFSILPEVAQSSSTLERRAEEAEREVHKLKKAEYMRGFIGERFEGIISGVTSWGIYVELDNTVEGMVRIDDMEGDDYRYEEEHFRMVRHRFGKIYALGQKVTIEVLRVDLELRTVDFGLPEGEE